MTRAVIYARVSTDAQAERHTIESQLIAARDYCEAKGWPVVVEFKDEGVSGATSLAERPEGKRLLEAATDEQFSHVVIYCPDRLGRDLFETLAAMKDLERLRVNVEFVVQSFDATIEGKLQFQVLMAVAEYESGAITRRMSQGRYRKVEAGAYLASFVPYGYVRDPATRGLRPHAWEAGIVRWIYRASVSGAGLQEIADELQERGVPTPNHGHRPAREWHHTTVYKLLTSPRYVGQATYGGRPMRCPALVDEVTQQNAAAALRRRRNRSGPRPRNFYALKGKVFCRRCGSLYYVSTMGGGRRQGKPVYRCGSKVRWQELAPDHTGVYKTHWLAEELEGRILSFLDRAIREPENLLREAEVNEQRAAGADAERAREEDRLRARLRDLDAQRERALTAYVRVGGSSQVLDSEVARIARERADTEAQLKGLERSPDAQRFEHYARNLRYLARLIAKGQEGTLLGTPLTPTYPSMHKLLDRVWVEDDGSLIIEGAIPGVIESPEESERSGKKLVPSH